jgi:nitrilase
MRISVIQMNQNSDKAANLAQARRLIEAALAADRPHLVSLPETGTTSAGRAGARLKRRAA